MSSDNRIFVLNRTRPRIVICTLDDKYLGDFASSQDLEAPDTRLSLPTSMAFNSQDNLHVVDEDKHKVYIYNSDGVFRQEWGDYGTGNGEMNGPSGIAFDSEDNAYVVDQNNHRIQKFDSDGKYIAQWGELGQKNAQFELPWGIAIDHENHVFVADWRNDRVQQFSSDGKFINSFGSSGDANGQLNRPSDVAVDNQGNIYVADWGNERIQVFDRCGNSTSNLRGSGTVSKWAEDFLVANLDEKLTRDVSNLFPDIAPHLDSTYHISSQNEAYFWGIASLTLDKKGRLYVTESNRHRFQVFQTNDASQIRNPSE